MFQICPMDGELYWQLFDQIEREARKATSSINLFR